MIQCPKCKDVHKLSLEVHGVKTGIGLVIENGEVADSDKTEFDPGYPVSCECLKCGYIGNAAEFGLDLSLEEALRSTDNPSIIEALDSGWEPEEPDDLLVDMHNSLTEQDLPDLADTIMNDCLGKKWREEVVPKKRLVAATIGYWEEAADNYLESREALSQFDPEEKWTIRYAGEKAKIVGYDPDSKKVILLTSGYKEILVDENEITKVTYTEERLAVLKSRLAEVKTRSQISEMLKKHSPEEQLRMLRVLSECAV